MSSSSPSHGFPFTLVIIPIGFPLHSFLFMIIISSLLNSLSPLFASPYRSRSPCRSLLVSSHFPLRSWLQGFTLPFVSYFQSLLAFDPYHVIVFPSSPSRPLSSIVIHSAHYPDLVGFWSLGATYRAFLVLFLASSFLDHGFGSSLLY